jgi:hypothetical protein
MSERDYGTTEEDVTDDSAEVTTRPAGGDDNAAMPDSNSTTGTTPNDEFVGRAGGVDIAEDGESGAEARAAAGDTGPA